MPMPVKRNKTTTIYQRVEPELYDALKTMAQKLEIKHTDLIRKVLWDCVDEFDAKSAINGF